ncbi:MAG: DUF6240 domain-containing protein, partial [Clostridiales bacterium]|nr:DUF6240 domain-containing protein [Clostridiales bacterium]
DDTLEYIKAFGEEYGETPDDALARHIYAMEKSGKLDEESREALVAVYKMLHIIQNDGKGLGAAVRSGEPLTLGRLLELTEARKVKVNLVAGDNKRHRAYKTAGRNIREILERSERPDNDEWYAARVMEGLARTAKPEALAETLSKENIYEMPIETALEYVAEANEQLAPEDDIRQAEQLAAAVQSLEDVPAAYIKRMTDSGIPPRFIDIIAFKNLMGGRPPGDELEGLKNKRFKEKIDGADLKNAAKGFDGYIESVCEAIKDAAELGGGETERVNAALRAIRLRYGASGGMDAYYLPVKLNDKITDVDMYIIGDNLDEKEQVRLVMMLRTAAGAVDMRLDMDGQGFSVSATAEGSDLDAEGGLTADLDAVYNGLREEGWEHEAIKPGTLPERLRAMASAMLKFLERN